MFLPIDAGTGHNLGYAYLNLISPLVAAQFWDTFSGFSNWWRAWGKAACSISWSTEAQGLEENIESHRNSFLMIDNGVPDEYRPVVVVNGVRVPFPAPTPKPDLYNGVAPSDSATVPSVVEPGFTVHQSSDTPSSTTPDMDPEMRTTLLLQNIPASYSREMLLGLFDNFGFA